jgi:hypothetical protein
MLAMLLTGSAQALLLGGGCMAKCEMFLDSVHLGPGHGFISIVTDERRANILHAQLMQSISDSNPTPAHIASLFLRRTINHLITSNQARFDEYSFPFRKQKMVEQFQSDNSTDILHKKPSDNGQM